MHTRDMLQAMFWAFCVDDILSYEAVSDALSTMLLGFGQCTEC